MQEGIRKKIKAQIKAMEDFLTENQDIILENKLNETLELLDELYELYKIFSQ